MTNYRAGAAGSMYHTDVYAPGETDPICICATHADAMYMAALLNALAAERDAALARAERMRRVATASLALLNAREQYSAVGEDAMNVLESEWDAAVAALRALENQP